MVKIIFNFLVSFFNEILIFESKRNKKTLKFKNYVLKKYKNKNQIKNSQINRYLKISEKYLRFKKKQTLFVLYRNSQAVSTGWMSENSNWLITEINKNISRKKTIILYDFFTFPNYRNKGYYTKILKLIKNFKTKKIFLIYSLKNNKKSCKGILKAQFVLKDKMRRLL